MKEKVKKILDDLNIEYRWEQHDEIKTYDDAIRIDKELGFDGTETKNLFLKDKSGKFYVLLTTSNVRFDQKFFKEKFGIKLSITCPQELIEKTKYVPGSAASYPYDIDVEYFVDNRIFDTKKLICSAGIPTESYEMQTKDLQKILDSLPNKKTYIDFI